MKESSQKSKKRKVEFSSKKEDFFGENRDNFDLGLQFAYDVGDEPEEEDDEMQ